VQRFADRHGWPSVGRATQVQDTVETMWDLGPIVTLHCVDDGITGNSYVYVSGEVANLAESYLRPAKEELATWSLDDLFAALDQANEPRERGMVLLKIAIAAPLESDERIVRRIEAAVASEDDLLRDMTVWAMSICTYPEFRPLLERVAENEPALGTRDRARALLRIYDRLGEVPEP
jgi:hypothetical protein